MARSRRFEVRLSAEHKDLLEQAAAHLGQTLTAFVRAQLLEDARTVLERATTTQLSRAAGTRFLAMLDDDTVPPALREAGRRYRALHRE